MKCPACGNSLSQVMVGKISVDVCQGGCAGIWFDAFELKKVDEPAEPAGSLLDGIQRKPSLVVDFERRRACPKCPEITMMRHFFSVKRDVAVDECPSCAGFWLDTGELATIRSDFKSEVERHQAAQKYFSSMFDRDLAKMHEESVAKAKQAQRIAKMLRVICPSYYIPGKQAGGAF